MKKKTRYLIQYFYRKKWNDWRDFKFLKAGLRAKARFDELAHYDTRIQKITTITKTKLIKD